MAKRVGFNYEILDDKASATKAQETAKQIHKLLEQSALSVISIGRLMADVKAGLTPVMFLAWVECEFGWVPSVASNYMQAARVFGELDCLKQFQPSAICMLARKNVPESVVKDAIKRARGGEMITYTLVHQLLRAAGHQPTNPSAGKPRKPVALPVVSTTGTTITQVRESVEALATNLTRLALEQSDRETLANKLFEMAMMLRLGPATPSATVPSPAAASATPAATIAVPAPKSDPAPASDKRPGPKAVSKDKAPKATADQEAAVPGKGAPTRSSKPTTEKPPRPSYSRAKSKPGATATAPSSPRAGGSKRPKRELATV